MTEETTLWKGNPSQWLNLGPVFGALLVSCVIIAGSLFFPPGFAALLLPLGYIIWKAMVIRSQKFELTTERLRVSSGVINQKIDEIELYRVKDSLMERPWWMRLTGLASIVLETSDRSMPRLVIPAIPDGPQLRELLRTQVELQRDRKRVRETDFDDMGAGDHGDHGDHPGT